MIFKNKRWAYRNDTWLIIYVTTLITSDHYQWWIDDSMGWNTSPTYISDIGLEREETGALDIVGGQNSNF